MNWRGDLDAIDCNHATLDNTRSAQSAAAQTPAEGRA
jgi:hypothetical protein